jgi:hypothetical protein
LRDLRGGTTISQWGTLRLRRTNHQNYSVRCFPQLRMFGKLNGFQFQAGFDLPR